MRDANNNYKTILDIFVRVNSGGTKLDAGDLMFAAMKEGWACSSNKQALNPLITAPNGNYMMHGR